MTSEELLSRVRRIEIKTRRLTNNIFAGEYHSAFKGRGMSFAEVREYQIGDDVRDIDWNVTARTGKPHIKVFEEERELTVMLLVDVSASLDFGTRGRTQRELATEIAATLAFSAIQNNDKIGVLFFSDRVEQYIPPKKGRKHILRIIHELLQFEPQHRRTDIRASLESLLRTQRKRCIAFVLSDFLCPRNFDKELSIAARRHDLVAVRLWDKRMAELPDVGLMKVVDAETGHEQLLDTSSRAVRRRHAAWWNEQQQGLDNLLLRSGVNHTSVATDGDYVKPLMNLFARKG